MNNLNDLTRQIINLSREAALKIMELYESDIAVTHKNDDSPLTAADMASHSTICNKLSKLTPDIPILSEESSNISFKQRSSWKNYWLIDPLDGTREFIKRNGEFTINIALVVEHQPVLGVVNIPVSGITYFASKNSGAFKQCNKQKPQKICTRRTDPANLTVAGSRSHGSAKQHEFVERLGNIQLIAIGSSLKFCLVAEGEVDIYPRYGPTSEWDTAAAQCIVEEAGGIVVDENFRKIEYNCKESLINPDFLVIADPAFDWRPYL
jgi:3'(2'), 5'-bisphosphate nucleotidase